METTLIGLNGVSAQSHAEKDSSFVQGNARTQGLKMVEETAHILVSL